MRKEGALKRFFFNKHQDRRDYQTQKKRRVEMYITRVDKFKESAYPTVINFLVDDSGSMSVLREKGVVIAALNQIMIPALAGVNKAEKNLLRVSLGAFSDGKIMSLTKTPGYYSIPELMKSPLSNSQLGRQGLDGCTALYASIIDGILSAKEAALQIRNQSGHDRISTQVVVITDGANNTNNPTTPADVSRAINNAGLETGYCVDLRVSLAYFETGSGLKRSEFENIAKACGLNTKKNCHFWADHPADFERQEKAFRRLVHLLSDPKNLK